MTLFVGCLAVWDWNFAVFPRRDTSLNILIFNDFSNFGAVIAAICDQHLRGRHIWQQHVCSLVIAALASRQMQADRAARAVANSVQFAVHAAFGATDQARIFAPFLRLKAVRCALRCVASIINTSASTPLGLANSSKIF